MIILKRTETDPYFNIAAEEYLLKHTKENCFTLWRNSKSVIVGRHQNTLAEINRQYVDEHSIPVIRRLSGGGAVFHDMGNICFTFVKRKEGEIFPDFKQFTIPIIEVLKSLNVSAQFEGRNDLTIDGCKFSGNANRIWKNRILHHGTLLFGSDIEDMSEAIKPNPLKFQGKAVKSVRSRITNISEHLSTTVSIEEFIDMVEKHIALDYPKAEYRTFTTEESKQIQLLANERYRSWEWNFGQSPKYEYSNRVHTENGGNIEAHWSVLSGFICDVRIFGDYFFEKETSEFECAIIGCLHEKEALRERIKQLNLSNYFSKVNENELLSLLF